jgi:hypothetical protein
LDVFDTGSSPVWTLQEGDNKPELAPLNRQIDRSPGAPFGVGTFLLFTPFRGPFQDLEFLFELPNLMSYRSKFSSSLGTIAGPASVIDVVLTQLGMQCDLVDTEISGGLFDLSTFGDERDRALTELWWVWAGHRSEPFMEAIG